MAQKVIYETLVFDGGCLIAVYRSDACPRFENNYVTVLRNDTNQWVTLRDCAVVVECVSPDSPMPVPQQGARLNVQDSKRRR